MRIGSRVQRRVGIGARMEVLNGYLLVTLEGEFQAESVLNIGGRISKLCHQSNIGKVLIDVRKVTGRVQLISKMDLAEAMIEKHRQHVTRGAIPVRVAHVVAEGMAEPGDFGETIAVNRGGTTFVTTSLEEALRWLEIEGKAARETSSDRQ